MKIAIIGSRTCRKVDIKTHLDESPTSIISGGAKGADTYARDFAKANNIPFTEFLPDYAKYGSLAPLIRNKLIVDHCDMVLAFWDGKSRGTKHTINYAKQQGKPVRIIKI